MGSAAAPQTPHERVTILPLRNAVLFPMSVVPINVGRPRSVRVVEDLMGQERALVGVATQCSPVIIEPTFADLYPIGTLARVVKVIRLGPANYRVGLNGFGPFLMPNPLVVLSRLARFETARPLVLEPFMRAEVERIKEPRSADERLVQLALSLREKTRQMLSLLPDLPKETAGILDNVKEAGALADLIA